MFLNACFVCMSLSLWQTTMADTRTNFSKVTIQLFVACVAFTGYKPYMSTSSLYMIFMHSHMQQIAQIDKNVLSMDSLGCSCSREKEVFTLSTSRNCFSKLKSKQVELSIDQKLHVLHGWDLGQTKKLKYMSNYILSMVSIILGSLFKAQLPTRPLELKKLLEWVVKHLLKKHFFRSKLLKLYVQQVQRFCKGIFLC